MAKLNKIDSNVTGLRFAEEETIGNLPSSGVTWFPLEPNSYGDFGPDITTISRNPINAARQRQKGVVTDLDAVAGFQQDLTQTNLQDILQGFFFADFRRKAEAAANTVQIVDVDGTAEEYTLSNLELDTVAVNAAGSGYVVDDILSIDNTGATQTVAATVRVTSVGGSGEVTGLAIEESGRYSVEPTDTTGNSLSGGSGTGATADLTFDAVITHEVGDLIFASNFTNSANNGLKEITAVSADNVTLTVSEDLVDETPPASADLVTVGFQGASGDLEIDASGDLPKLISTSKDLTELGVIPGEWIRIGGDASATQFGTSADNGYARVKSVATNEIVLDKTQDDLVTDNGSGQTVRIFLGRVLKNEASASLQKRRTYQIERTLGEPETTTPNATQAEYAVGSVANEFTLNYNTADKITADLAFLATDGEQRTTAQGLKSGSRPSLVSEDAYNTSNDIARLKLSILDPANANPSALFAFVTEFTLAINNNVSANKAVSVLGAFDMTAGQFNVDGNARAYFSTVEAVQAIRNNEDVTLDFIQAKNNVGIAVDVPLIALGEGRLDVTQDEPIILPIAMPAAADRNFDHTLLMVFFDYLPDAAMAAA